MAKIKITIEDKLNGGVSVVATPSFETMAKMVVSGSKTTSAHGYAITMIRAVQKASKQNKSQILIPRIGRQ